MKLQDLLIPLFLALLTTWGIQYFFVTRHLPPQPTEVQSGQSFKVPTMQSMLKPIMTDVTFINAPGESSKTSVIETPLALYNLTTTAASLAQFSVNHTVDHQQEWLKTIDDHVAQKPENAAFLLALAQDTPLMYTLLDERKEGDLHHVRYQAETPQARVIKEFIVHQNTYQIDLMVTIEPLLGNKITPRIFLPGPEFNATQGAILSAVVCNEQQTIQKIKRNEVEHSVWAAPTLFGIEDRYFIHALINDPDRFVDRAYYKLDETHHMIAILEGPEIEHKTSWKLSFYCGPKRVESFAAVDSRLDETLDYGWFAPISKLLLVVLNAIYRLVHNYGWAIVILTILLRLIMVPFTLRGDRSAEKRAELSRKMQYLEQKYKHDREALAREKMELIRKNGVLPDAAGCLPNLISIPIFIGLNRVLTNSIDLYHAPFVGWITDLSVQDPYYVLPALIAFGIIAQQFGQTDPRQQVVVIIMALLVAGVTAQLSAGLALFICVSILTSVLQTFLQRKFKW